MIHTLQRATEDTEVLLVHAPYPGDLKFRGVPSSLLAAAAPFVDSSAALEHPAGYLDPVASSPAFYAELRSLLLSGRVRALCLSTSTAAIEEAARIARLTKTTAPDVIVIAGGPHEDDCDLKMAEKLPDIDISVAGQAEFLLERLLTDSLGSGQTARRFCLSLPDQLRTGLPIHGQCSLTGSCWGGVRTVRIDGPAPPASSLRTRVVPDELPRFSVFDAPYTLPVMVSRGCPYGRCTFCAEAIRGGGSVVHENFDWIADLMAMHPGAALYFQDSIFPNGRAVRERLLPLLRDLDVEWGAQVYLRMLGQRTLRDLASHGCRYVYTGLESGSAPILDAVGKAGLSPELALERLGWTRDLGLRVGVSLMFGVMAPDGALLETPDTVSQTLGLAEAIIHSGVDVTGFYPNVLTVLPATRLARGLAESGIELDFYRMPRAPVFDVLEDGGIGYNFLTCRTPSTREQRLALRIRDAALSLSKLTDALEFSSGVERRRA